MKLPSIATAAALLAITRASFAQSTQSGGSVGATTTRCDSLIGAEKDERAGTGSTSGRAAGAGGSHAPGSTGTGAGTMGPQNAAPSGSVR